MTYGEDCHTVSYLLLNVLFGGGLPARLGADVDGTRLALAIIWYPVDRLQEAKETTCDNFVFVLMPLTAKPRQTNTAV